MATNHDNRNQSFMRWFMGEMLTTEHFKNTITLILVLTYCGMAFNGIKMSSEFSMLVGMALGFYFKKE